jgi:methyl-accepting chemotaxis protein
VISKQQEVAEIINSSVTIAKETLGNLSGMESSAQNAVSASTSLARMVEAQVGNTDKLRSELDRMVAEMRSLSEQGDRTQASSLALVRQLEDLH